MNNLPDPEKQRINALANLNILHSAPEDRFNRIVGVAKNVFGLPIAGVALVDYDIVWFKAVDGIDIEETPRSGSFSSIVISQKDLAVIEDASRHPTLKDNILVKKHKIKFYSGAPITTSNGLVLGDLFVADTTPRKFNDLQKKVLKDLAVWVEDELQKSKLLNDEQKVRNDLVMRNRELTRQKAQSEAMLGDIGDGVIGINDKGEISFANHQVEVMTGYTIKELVGEYLIQAIKMLDENGENASALDNPIRQALFYNKKVQSRRFMYVRKDNVKFPVAITATPVVVYNQIIGGVVVFRDITKEMEVDRMKTEFISLASHQLRTPLSAMKWFCEILIEGDAGKLTDEQQEMLVNIYKSNERMIDLVNTLLNISRIESGRILIDPRPTDLRKLVEEVITEARQRLDQKKQHLAVSVHKQLPLVSLDPKLVRHVYLNLLTNAIKYTPQGGEVVIIISKVGGKVISQISDTGIGIPKNQQSRVFKKFFRAENIVKMETEGTGLGLYLAKAIVESSGGKIWFSSIEGKGTTFWFSLPMDPIKKAGVVTIDS